ncbi:MAG: hypothetical protein MZV64_71490 [Ignavibacteriales bacterium]|nr:hypothetical protein [Ignavibacteriales bacterium]
MWVKSVCAASPGRCCCGKNSSTARSSPCRARQLLHPPLQRAELARRELARVLLLQLLE